LIYLLAFLSLGSQIRGLFGSHGVLPVATEMSQAHAAADTSKIGLDRYRLLPTFCWWSASDRSLVWQCGAGVAFSVLALAGIASPLCFLALWLLYLSFCSVGGVFFGYQWDALLLETGFLAIFFAPLKWFSIGGQNEAVPKISLWLLRLLLFRLMLESGWVKLASGDPTWRGLTALRFHYETQPLPTWIGWYAHQLPMFLQKSCCFVLLIIELGCPFLIFGPRRIRLFACNSFIALQVLILLTGNYCFFNLLTILLCVTLRDDFAFGWLQRLLPRQQQHTDPKSAFGALPTGRWPRPILLAVACLSIGLTSIPLFYTLRFPVPLPRSVLRVYTWFSPTRSFNNYGLFAVMTTNRNEIVLEGSDDGANWQAYEFGYKPGRLDRRPMFVAPHQPRLDWQMWFAALGDYRQNPWLINFCARLLQGQPEVTALLEKNPFRDHPPKYIRARFFEYHFTTLAEHRHTGNWWIRELKGDYLRPFTLSDLGL
jgi:hypothetical protein